MEPLPDSWKSFSRMLLPLILLILSINFFQYQGSYFFVESFNFSFDSFNSDSCNNGSRLICWGSVSSGNGSLYLTPELQQQENRQIGRVLFRYPINAWPASFSTIFTVRFLTNSTVSGDGIAFVIAQDDRPSPPQSFGSYIGMLDPSSEGGVLRQLAVELDSYQNEHEIDGNHMAVVTTSVEYPLAVRSLSSIGIDLRSGRDITIKIDYDGWSKNLQTSAAYTGNPLTSFLSHKILMEETVPRSAYVGFTASTAYFIETHQVLSWNFTSFELDNKSLKQGANMKNVGRIVLSAVIPAVVVLLVVLLIVVQSRKKKAREGGLMMRRGDIEILTRNAANAPKFYTYRQLAKATRNFNKENLIGTGGFGCVYKGVLADPSTIIAVKRINATSGQGEKEYLAEICTIGRLRHKNLVQLQGWCHDKDKLFLVYEYMPNGSLDRYIGKIFLYWKTRFNILIGLASALLYLHEECGNPVVHRDVKPNNVMLDSEYNAHLGDFGLARILLRRSSNNNNDNEDDQNNFVTTMVAGTPGYLAPEVSYTGRATPESDVYSFGMVVLEVVSGRRTRGMTLEENSLLDHVWSKHEKDELLASVDKTLLIEGKKSGCHGEKEEEQMRRAILVGLACLHPDRMYRPRMRKVVQIFLNPNEPLMKVPESRPTAVSLSLRSSGSDSSTNTEYDDDRSTKFKPCRPPQAGSMESIPDEMTMVFDPETDDTKRMV